MAVAIFLGLLSSLIVLFIFESFFNETQTLMESTGMNEQHPLGEYFLQQHNQITMFVGAIFCWFAAMNTIVLIMFTHRIAGPAYRLKKCMEEMLAGELEKPVKLRDGDFFQDTAQLLDQIREKLKQKQ